MTNKAFRDILLALYAKADFVPVEGFSIDESKEKTEFCFIMLMDAKLVMTVAVGEKDDTPMEQRKVLVRLTWTGLEACKLLKNDTLWNKVYKENVSFSYLLDKISKLIEVNG